MLLEQPLDLSDQARNVPGKARSIASRMLNQLFESNGMAPILQADRFWERCRCCTRHLRMPDDLWDARSKLHLQTFHGMIFTQ